MDLVEQCHPGATFPEAPILCEWVRASSKMEERMPNASIVEQAAALREWSREVREASRVACAQARALLIEIERAERERAAGRVRAAPVPEVVCRRP